MTNHNIDQSVTNQCQVSSGADGQCRRWSGWWSTSQSGVQRQQRQWGSATNHWSIMTNHAAGCVAETHERGEQQGGVTVHTLLRSQHLAWSGDTGSQWQYQVVTNHSEPIITTDQSLSTNHRSVTQEFLVGLQENFPSTIPTVNRTGDKLTIASGADTDHDTDDTDLCCMCGSSLDTDADSCHNALQATQVSRPHQSVTNQWPIIFQYSSFISSGGVKNSDSQRCSDKTKDSSSECCGQGDGSCQSRSSESVSMSDVLQSLCYTCRRTFDGVTDVDNVPGLVVDRWMLFSDWLIKLLLISDWLTGWGTMWGEGRWRMKLVTFYCDLQLLCFMNQEILFWFFPGETSILSTWNMKQWFKNNINL